MSGPRATDRPPVDEPPLVGLVLAGGASRRMGRDKAAIEVDGIPMGVRVAAAMTAAGAEPVVAVGGDEALAQRWRGESVADRWPGAGPLGGLVTGLEHLSGQGFGEETVVLVAAVDLPWLRPTVLADLAHRLRAGDHEVVAPHARGRLQVLAAAYRLGTGLELGRAFAAGERSLTVAVERLRVAAVEVAEDDDAWLRDVDTPDDLGER